MGIQLETTPFLLSIFEIYRTKSQLIQYISTKFLYMRPGKWALISSIFVLSLFSNCAGPYKAFKMETIPFKEPVSTDNKVSYSTRQGVMYNTRNYRYAKKELKDQYSLMAVKIINQTDYVIALNDLNYSCGGSTNITPIPMEVYLKTVKQKAGLYWLYAAGVVPNPFCKGCLKYVIPWGIVPAAVGFGVGLRSNKKMEKELNAYDLRNKVVQPHDSIMGILPFKGISNCGDIYITVK